MIRIQNLTKTFGDFTAVKDVSLDIAAGEIVAFLGPNGAGKTTTIKMLTTLLKPTSGRIEIDGLNPENQPNEVRQPFRHRVPGFQRGRRVTAQENMGMTASVRRSPANLRGTPGKAAQLFELRDRRKE